MCYNCIRTDFLRHVMQDIGSVFSLFTGNIYSLVCRNYFMEGLFCFITDDAWTILMIMCGRTESLAAVSWLFSGLSRIVVVLDGSRGQAKDNRKGLSYYPWSGLPQ